MEEPKNRLLGGKFKKENSLEKKVYYLLGGFFRDFPLAISFVSRQFPGFDP